MIDIRIEILFGLVQRLKFFKFQNNEISQKQINTRKLNALFEFVGMPSLFTNV